MQDFKDLKVWRKAHELTLRIYVESQGFPRQEQFGLTAQMRRAAGSIPANIAEGCGRRTRKEFAQFLQVAIGSANELEYHLLLARDLSYLSRGSHDETEGQLTEVRRMLSSLVTKVREAA